MRFVGMLAICLALVFAGCGDSGESDGLRRTSIVKAETVDATTLLVFIGACHGDRNKVVAQEDDQEVRLIAETDDPPEGPLCSDGVRVNLRQPLGDRRLVDDSRNPVRVTPFVRPP